LEAFVPAVAVCPTDQTGNRITQRLWMRPEWFQHEVGRLNGIHTAKRVLLPARAAASSRGKSTPNLGVACGPDDTASVRYLCEAERFRRAYSVLVPSNGPIVRTILLTITIWIAHRSKSFICLKPALRTICVTADKRWTSVVRPRCPDYRKVPV